MFTRAATGGTPSAGVAAGLAAALVLAAAGCQSDLPAPADPVIAREWVEASARYHDPAGRYTAFAATLEVETRAPGAAAGYVNEVYLDRARDTFRRRIDAGGFPLTQTVGPASGCAATWPKPDATEEQRLRNGLLGDPCRYIAWRRDYYTWLVGLPMSALEGEVGFGLLGETEAFGATCVEVELAIPDAPGGPTWYLYVDRETHRLVASRFASAPGAGEWLHYPGLTDFDGYRLKARTDWYRADARTPIVRDTLRYARL